MNELERAILAAAEQNQVIQFNPDAALQAAIFRDGFVPNSGEFDIMHSGAVWRGQRAEHLGSGEVRAYYCQVPRWDEVYYVTRPEHVRQNLTHEYTFEAGDLRGLYWHQNAPEVASTADGHPVRDGDYSMRCYVHRYDSKYAYRTAIVVGKTDQLPPDTRDPLYLPLMEVIWIAFSVYLPGDWVIDKEGLGERVFGCQATPDEGELYRQGVTGLAIDHDQWVITAHADRRAFTPPEEGTTSWTSSKRWELPLGPSLGRWTDWVIQVRYDWTAAGFLNVWRDGEQVVGYTGPIGANDQVGPHIGLGVYKWPWRESYSPPYQTLTVERLLYIDAVRIGTSAATYADVAP